MQRHRPIAERELRLQERHDIALQVDGIEIEAGEEPAVPGGAGPEGIGRFGSHEHSELDDTRSVKHAPRTDLSLPSAQNLATDDRCRYLDAEAQNSQNHTRLATHLSL
jgi:hypothetical protein